MKKIVGLYAATPFVIMLLLIFCINNVYAAGNINSFDALAKQFGYSYAGEIDKGWHSYTSQLITNNVRVNDSEDICEGFIVAKPTSDDNVLIALENIYGALCNTLNMEHINVLLNVKKIYTKVMVGLERSNKYEFNYNEHIRVRGQVIGVSNSERLQGKEPVIIIKLWIYK